MAFDVWTSETLIPILRALHDSLQETKRAARMWDADSQSYERGFCAALNAMARAVQSRGVRVYFDAEQGGILPAAKERDVSP